MSRSCLTRIHHLGEENCTDFFGLLPHRAFAMTVILKRIELLANTAIIIIAVLLASVLIKNYLWQSNSLQSSSKAPTTLGQDTVAGQKINLTDIDWQKNRQTLLLILSTKCRFCTESAPFYQQLVKVPHRKRWGFRVIHSNRSICASWASL
jgi:hypothetical protein